MYLNPITAKKYRINSYKLKELYRELESLYHTDTYEWHEYKQVLKARISYLEDIQISIYKDAKAQIQHRDVAKAQEARRVKFTSFGSKVDY